MSEVPAIRPALQEVILLYRERLIGFTEARNLIESVIPEFEIARDNEMDAAFAEELLEEQKVMNELAEARGDGQKVGDDE